MKTVCLLLSILLWMSAAPSQAADGGVATIVEGNPSLLRGASWYKLAEGVRIQEGDVIDTPAASTVQLELLDGSSLGVQGPASIYAVTLPVRDGKLAGSAEFYLPKGWLKLAAPNAKNGVRVRTPLNTIAVSDGVVVIRSGDAADVFIESGSARLTDPGRKPTEATPVAKAGEFWSRSAASKAFTTAPRAPPTFISAMPQHFMVTMPDRMAKFQSHRVEPMLLRDATFADAEPWLATPYRNAFVNRFQARLKEDPAFQKAAEPRVRDVPEPDKTLRPEPAKKAEPAPPPPPPPATKSLWERLFERSPSR
jgi:hypothetical protein